MGSGDDWPELVPVLEYARLAVLLDPAEARLDLHPGGYLLWGHVHYLAQDPDAIPELDEPHHVWRVLLETDGRVLDYGPCYNLAFLGELVLFELR